MSLFFPVDFIKFLDHKINYERYQLIENWLVSRNLDYRIQKYPGGRNITVDIGHSKKRIGISSHFDKYSEAGGANDNGSAVVVCLDVIDRLIKTPIDDVGVRIFFFDEEENGLNGSIAYVKEFGINDLIGLINMELVGIGDQMALWPLNDDNKGKVLETLEYAATQLNIRTRRFDNIITNTADHLPFRKAGLKDSFTITCISDKDVEVASHYYRAMEFDVSKETLQDILGSAPIFKDYHKPTDTYDKISASTIDMTTSLILNVLKRIAM